MNLGFKNIPLILFLALLIVLIISVYFGNSTTKWAEKEGYVAFNYSSTPLTMVNLVPYANNRSVMKLYDNIYYDKQSAYLIELSGNLYQSGNVQSGNVSLGLQQSGNVSLPINSLSVYCPREGRVGGPYAISSMDKLANIPERQVSRIKPENDAHLIRSADGNTIFFYFSNGIDTYIHVIDMSSTINPMNAYSVGFIRDNDRTYTRYYGLPEGSSTVDFSRTSNAIDLATLSEDDLSEATEAFGNIGPVTGYDASQTAFYVLKQFAVDLSNGNLLYMDASDSVYVYPRQNSAVRGQYRDANPTRYTKSSPMAAGSAPKQIKDTTYYPWWTITADKKFYIYIVQAGVYMYGFIMGKGAIMGVATKFVIYPQTDSSPGVTSGSSGSVTPSGKSDYDVLLSRINDIADIVEKQQRDNDLKDEKGTDGEKSEEKTKDDYMNEYKWFKFWNGVAQSDDLSAVFTASNLIPKTAVIPPVCPTCPSCAGNQCGGGVCTNCGGQGGSGTLQGNRFADYLSRFGSGTKNLIENTGKGTKDLIEDTGRGASQLARDTASGTVGLAKDTASGTVGLAREAVGGTVGLAREAVGGTVGLAKEVVGGTVGLAKDVVGGFNPVQINAGGYPMQNQYQRSAGSGMIAGSPFGQQPTPVAGVPGADPYSYYGKLPNKASSNYIPVTADFSAFSK